MDDVEEVYSEDTAQSREASLLTVLTPRGGSSSGASSSGASGSEGRTSSRQLLLPQQQGRHATAVSASGLLPSDEAGVTQDGGVGPFNDDVVGSVVMEAGHEQVLVGCGSCRWS